MPGGIARDGVPQPGVAIKLLPLSGEEGGGGGDGRGEGLGEMGEIGEILVRTSRGGIVGGAEGGALDTAVTACTHSTGCNFVRWRLGCNYMYM